MGYQVGTIVEALPALGASVGLLTLVGPLMGQEVGMEAQGLPTLSTTVGSLSGVDPVVLGRV